MLLGLNGKKAVTPKAAGANSEARIIFNATTADFERSVLQASMKKPVMVDFWAPWCGPCKQLTPVLEAAVEARRGQILLAKVNIDENPDLAQAFRVQSIPFVVALFMGQAVTGFSGVRPKSEIDALLDQLAALQQQQRPEAPDVPALLKEAEAALTLKDFAQVQQIYGLILAQDENNAQAYLGLTRLHILLKDFETAGLMLRDAPDTVRKDSLFSSAQTALDLAQATPKAASAVLAGKIQTAPEDYQLQYDYAEACLAEGDKEAAADALLGIIRKNRAWEEDKARLQLLKYFEAWGPMDPATLQGRRKLSALLFS